MSRFSPGSVTQDRSGEIIGAAISQALGGIGARRRQNEIRKRQDAETQRQNAIQNAQLGEQGIHLLSPGEHAPVERNGADVAQTIASALNPSLGLPAVAAPSPRIEEGKGYYIDRGAQEAKDARAAKAQFQSILSQALAKGQAENIVDPYARSDRHAVAQSTVERNNRPPAPTPQQHVVDSVTGEVKFFDPTKPPLGLRVNPAPTPTQVHASNRLFDVQHPMPTQDNGKMTEFSNKAALVYPRAAEAAQVLEPFFRSGVPATSVLGKVTFGQYGVPENVQQANQAAETISSAILRLESGAAISEHEVKEYAKQFLPQPGDSHAVLAQKRATLQTQLERMRQAANPTMRRDTAAPMTGGDTGGKTITVNGKTFKVPE